MGSPRTGLEIRVASGRPAGWAGERPGRAVTHYRLRNATVVGPEIGTTVAVEGRAAADTPPMRADISHAAPGNQFPGVRCVPFNPAEGAFATARGNGAIQNQTTKCPHLTWTYKEPLGQAVNAPEKGWFGYRRFIGLSVCGSRSQAKDHSERTVRR